MTSQCHNYPLHLLLPPSPAFVPGRPGGRSQDTSLASDPVSSSCLSLAVTETSVNQFNIIKSAITIALDKHKQSWVRRVFFHPPQLHHSLEILTVILTRLDPRLLKAGENQEVVSTIITEPLVMNTIRYVRVSLLLHFLWATLQIIWIFSCPSES